MDIKSVYQQNIVTMDLVSDMIRLFRKQNFNRGDRLFPTWIQNFSALVGIFLKEIAYLNEYGAIVNGMEISGMLKEIMEAQEQKDYILLADLLELRTNPLLASIQEVLRAKAGEEADTLLFMNYFDANLSYLRNTQPQLADLLQKQYEKMRVAERTIAYLTEPDGTEKNTAVLLTHTDLSRACTYEVEQTTQGAPTLKITDKNGSYYVHGNNIPMEEARLFAEHYYDVKKEQYLLYGLGLGYHVRAMFAESCGVVPITVFESDLNILVFALQSSNFVPLFSKGVQFIFDPDFTLFVKQLENTSEAPVIHYPSLRNISVESIKKRMEELFVQDSSVRNQLGEMLANFRSNVKNCGHYADELSGLIKGKDVYLVAAGPSLDKNVELLKEKPENAVVIVVGRAFWKLLQLGIRPDFAVFLDAADRIYGQLRGLEQETVPLLIGSTACKRIAENYKGETYLICQEGFYEAERYAKENGFQTYLTGGSVATIAFDLAIRLGAKRVIAIGLDLAYTGNKIHAMNAGRRELWDDMTGLIKIKPSDGGMVYTNPAMEMYREWFGMRIAKARKEQDGQLPEFINATEGGAYIEGMEYCTLAEAILKRK